jgi:hypothetical protein
MQIRDDILAGSDNPEVVNPVPIDRTYRLYKYNQPNDNNPISEYGELVVEVAYALREEIQCPPQYKHQPFVMAWTVPSSDFFFKNMDFYAQVGQHETIHQDEDILSADDHGMEEHLTRARDDYLKMMGCDRRSNRYRSTTRVHDTSHYIV